MATVMTALLQLTVELCNAQMLRQLKHAEALLRERGASAQEVERAIGADGYMRRMLQEDCAAQIWRSGCAMARRCIEGESDVCLPPR
jgi:hypothetical protein